MNAVSAVIVGSPLRSQKSHKGKDKSTTPRTAELLQGRRRKATRVSRLKPSSGGRLPLNPRQSPRNGSDHQTILGTKRSCKTWEGRRSGRARGLQLDRKA